MPPQPQDPNDEGGCTMGGGVPDPYGHSKRPAQGYESSSNRPASSKEQRRLQDKTKNGAKEKVKRNAPTKSDSNSDKSKENTNDVSDSTSANADKENLIQRNNCDENPIACGIMFRKIHLLDVGLYDESFYLHEERELRIRFEKKYKIQKLEHFNQLKFN